LKRKNEKPYFRQTVRAAARIRRYGSPARWLRGGWRGKLGSIGVKKWVEAGAFAVIAASVTGCVLLADAGASNLVQDEYLIQDNATKEDGKFDPLEKAPSKDDGRN